MSLYETIDQSLIVYLPSGAGYPTMNVAEVDYINNLITGYLEMRFEHASDLSELDRLVTMELMSHRWQTWQGLGCDYKGGKLDPKLEEKHQKLSSEIRQIKAKLGIDKLTRDRTRGEGSVHQRMTSLLQRARAFELYRCRQHERALELQNEMIALTQLYRNTRDHPEEMKELGVRPEDILEWVWERLKPEYEEIAEHFAEHEQHIWHMEDSRLEAGVA